MQLQISLINNTGNEKATIIIADGDTIISESIIAVSDEENLSSSCLLNFEEGFTITIT